MGTQKRCLRAGHSEAIGTEAGTSYPTFNYSHFDANVKYIVRQTSAQILDPLIIKCYRLGLVELADDLDKLGRSWQARGVAA